KHIRLVIIHAEHKTSIDHDAERMEVGCYRRIVASQILSLATGLEICRRQRLKADEETAKPGIGRALDQIIAKDGVDRGRSLKKTIPPLHFSKQISGETRLP